MPEMESQQQPEKTPDYLAAEALAQKVFEVIAMHDAMMVDLKNPDVDSMSEASYRNVMMLVQNHLAKIENFHKRRYGMSPMPYATGVHAHMGLHDVLTHERLLLSMSSALTHQERTVRVVEVTHIDEGLLASNVVIVDSSGQLDAQRKYKVSNSELVQQTIEIIGDANRDLILPLLSGKASPQEADRCLANIKYFAEMKGVLDPDKLVLDLTQHYHAGSMAIALSRQVNKALNVEDLDVLSQLVSDQDKWT